MTIDKCFTIVASVSSLPGEADGLVLEVQGL